TSTTFAGALAAFYCKIPVGHVEAGLRTYDKYSPYPEEMNRKLTTALTDLYFAPTMNNRDNLLKELVPPDKIFVTGNTVIDAVRHTVTPDYAFQTEALRQIDFSAGRVILLTAHRRENLGEPLVRILTAVRTITETHPDVQVIYPMHLNPAVRDTARAILGGHDRIHLIEPVDVEELHNLMSRCYFVMTDSGGLQEEAPSLGKPVLVLRSETERPEAVYAGTVKIAGTEEEKIRSMADELLDNPAAYAAMSRAVNPYGDGKASARIADAILYAFGRLKTRPAEWNIQ
ncbi:MAG: non-hydrolyzing UDP-N-acetylglucosamine 2-epimerase, partial [Clostridia bacterium]